MDNGIGGRLNTVFLQSPKDLPSPDPGVGRLQTPVDGPQPQQDLFAAALEEGIPDTLNYPKWVQNLISLRRREDREKLKFREKADIAWERYNNNYDFSDKEAWQARKVPPKVYLMVERLASLIYRVLEKSSEWATIESLDESSDVYYNMVKHLIFWFLDHDSVNFKKQFRLNLKSGLLWQQMYFMVCWESEGMLKLNGQPIDDPGLVSKTDPVGNFFSVGPATSDGKFEDIQKLDSNNNPTILPGRNTPRLRIKPLNPDYVWQDSTNRNRHIIWEVRYSRGEARREAKTSGWDMEATERALMKPFSSGTTTDNVNGYQESRDANKQDRIQDHKTYQNAKVTYFFGDFPDEETGEILMENCFFAILNDAEVVIKPVSNPFWDGEFPIISAPITEVPFTAYGKSPIVQNMDMFELYVETLNMMIDYMQSILLGMKEVDLDVMDDSDEDLRSGFFPGKVIKKRGQGNPGVAAVTNIPTSDLPPGLWNAWGVYQREVQDGVMVTDAVGGQARTRGRVTAMEFNRRAADAGDMIQFLFESLQDNCLQPVVRKSFHVILQSMPQAMWANWVENHKKKIAPTDPELKKVWDAQFDKVKAWTPQERWNNLAGFFRNKVRVFSALGDQQAEIEKATFFLQTVAQVPGLAPHIKYPNLGRNIARAFGWDPEEVISADALPLPAGAAGFIDPSAENSDDPIPTTGLPQPGGFGGMGPQSISTSPPFAPGTGGAGQPP